MAEVVIALIIVGVLWKVGALATAKTVISVANTTVHKAAVIAEKEMIAQEDAHQISLIKRYNKMEDVSEDMVKGAQAKVATIRSFKL